MIDILDRVSGLLIVLSVCWQCREELRGLLEAARSLDEFPGDCQEELHERNGSQNEQSGKNTTNDASTPLPAATEAASNNKISLPTEEDAFTSTTYKPSTLTTPSPPVSEIASKRKGKDKEPIRYASPSFHSSATTVRVSASSPASPTVTPSPIECTTSKVVPKSTAISPSWAFPPYQNAAFNPTHQLKRATFSFGAAGFVGPRPSAAATPETCTRVVDSAEPVKSPWLKRSKKEKVAKEALVLEVVSSQEAASAFGSNSAFGELLSEALAKHVSINKSPQSSTSSANTWAVCTARPSSSSVVPAKLNIPVKTVATPTTAVPAALACHLPPKPIVTAEIRAEMEQQYQALKTTAFVASPMTLVASPASKPADSFQSMTGATHLGSRSREPVIFASKVDAPASRNHQSRAVIPATSAVGGVNTMSTVPVYGMDPCAMASSDVTVSTQSETTSEEQFTRQPKKRGSRAGKSEQKRRANALKIEGAAQDEHGRGDDDV